MGRSQGQRSSFPISSTRGSSPLIPRRMHFPTVRYDMAMGLYATAIRSHSDVSPPPSAVTRRDWPGKVVDDTAGCLCSERSLRVATEVQRWLERVKLVG